MSRRRLRRLCNHEHEQVQVQVQVQVQGPPQAMPLVERGQFLLMSTTMTMVTMMLMIALAIGRQCYGETDDGRVQVEATIRHSEYNRRNKRHNLHSASRLPLRYLHAS
jgi:hypothetical protein